MPCSTYKFQGQYFEALVNSLPFFSLGEENEQFFFFFLLLLLIEWKLFTVSYISVWILRSKLQAAYKSLYQKITWTKFCVFCTVLSQTYGPMQGIDHISQMFYQRTGAQQHFTMDNRSSFLAKDGHNSNPVHNLFKYPISQPPFGFKLSSSR